MLKQRIQTDMKIAMKAGDKSRLAVIRLILAAIKQREVDERIVLDDVQVMAVLDKMVKQRRESIVQFTQAERGDLVAQENFELEICQQYLPSPLDDSAIQALINQAIAATAASSIKDMGKVMSWLKPNIQGRADAGAVSAKVKIALNPS
ncbi:glutamyl-tRNA amidotransferase [Achromatium sp. WMS2]|nr:glutamyl-tRNA amidotransferase [Achromatium sp. WMS2]